MPAAWLSLDENDNDIGIFLRYVIAAINTVFPDLLSTSKSLLTSQILPPLPVLSTSLNNDIEQLPAHFILVLDDYHLVNSAAVQDLLMEKELPQARFQRPMTHLLLNT